MSGITPHLVLLHRQVGILNGARFYRWTFARNSRTSQRCLATGRPLNKTSPSSSATNSALSRIQNYSPSISKCFSWYAHQQNRRPYIMELCTMALIYSIGDFSAQILGGDGYDAHRTVRSITIGAMVATPSRKWFLFLSRHFNYSSVIRSTCTKVVVNQLVYTTLFNVYFFASHAILSGMGIPGAIERVKDTVPTSLPRSFLYWPFVTAFNFTYVQPQSRSVVTAIFSVFWQSYLSWLNAKAQKHETLHASTFDLLD